MLEHFQYRSKKVLITQNIRHRLFAGYSVPSASNPAMHRRHVVPLLPLFSADTGERFA
jgi:hypothetical protein